MADPKADALKRRRQSGENTSRFRCGVGEGQVSMYMLCCIIILVITIICLVVYVCIMYVRTVLCK